MILRGIGSVVVAVCAVCSLGCRNEATDTSTTGASQVQTPVSPAVAGTVADAKAGTSGAVAVATPTGATAGVSGMAAAVSGAGAVASPAAGSSAGASAGSSAGAGGMMGAAGTQPARPQSSAATNPTAKTTCPEGSDAGNCKDCY